MNVLAWILSAALAATYIPVGILKMATPAEKLRQNPRMGWANDYSQSQIRGIGLAEILGGIGVILPWATGILPFLTPIAAIGLVALQVGAIMAHLRRGEKKVVPGNLSLLVLAAAVAIIRFTQLGH